MSQEIQRLQSICATVRKDIVEMVHRAGSGHPGGSLSAVELLVGLYFSKLRHDPLNSGWAMRDRFFLSKGHACPVLYSVLARAGYFPVEELGTLRKLESNLQGHPNMHKLNGLESSSGSLGQALSIANGAALAAKMDKKDIRVYCLMGDGELDEGQVWEAAMTAAQHKLNNVCAVVDFNKLQLDGSLESIKNLEPLTDKWKAFNWNVIEIDGHDMEQVLAAYDQAAACTDKPSVIVAHTVKGKGVSFMENKAEWHGKAPNKEELELALEEIERRLQP